MHPSIPLTTRRFVGLRVAGSNLEFQGLGGPEGLRLKGWFNEGLGTLNPKP